MNYPLDSDPHFVQNVSFLDSSLPHFPQNFGWFETISWLTLGDFLSLTIKIIPAMINPGPKSNVRSVPYGGGITARKTTETGKYKIIPMMISLNPREIFIIRVVHYVFQ